METPKNEAIAGIIVTSGIVFVMAYFLQAILADLALIAFVFFASNIVDFVAIQPAITRTKKGQELKKHADVTAEAVKSAVEQIVGRV